MATRAQTLAASARLRHTLRPIMAQVTFNNDLDVFNFALTLEHLEHAFYRDGLQTFTANDFALAGYSGEVFTYFDLIRDHERIHVDVIAETIAGAGGTPVQEAIYDFGYANVTEFVQVAQVLENVGVRAYTGAAASISDRGLLTAALTIHGVEARHAAYLNNLIWQSPFPDSFEIALSPDEVLAAAGGFIIDAPDTTIGGQTGGETSMVAAGAAGVGTGPMMADAMPATGGGPQVPGILRDRW